MGEETTSLAPLPKLPVHYNPIKSLSAAEQVALVDAILSHYENGRSIYDLAQELGVNDATLYRALKKHRLEDWKEVASARYESEIADAEKELKEARDPLAVTRARERIASARWKLERIDRRIYGQDAPAAGSAVQININLRRENAATAQDIEVKELSGDVR